MTLSMDRNIAAAMRRRLNEWYMHAGRDLPWRRTRNPYQTLVAEFMLQQTGVARVSPAYEAFLERFPTVQALANASAADVIRAWSGLGYNRRAINLQRSARAIVDDYGGSVPSDPATLQRLPGVGPYTAAAIACFAFQCPVAVMDTNIRRVLGRLILGRQDIDAARGWRLAEAILPESGAEASSWHQALMDLGASLCSVTKPACGDCPVSEYCAARPVLTGEAAYEISNNATPGNQVDRQYATPLQSEAPALRVAERHSPSSYGWVGTSRYYRGRIVEALRRHPAGELPINALGPLVREDYSETDHSEWLHGVLTKLQQDGLVTIRGDSAMLPE